ncbi:MAG: 16S rRNA (guanine(966)-N(2))-methyltransferase RsmD [Candidatus Eisenbacteria bacterium]|nr:16S rRNA (guanine(966)-N(2))-methyltransferase RsmD [Candidatus Eisenbacteria bacterium]
MRIVSGVLGGRKLLSPPAEVRPTQDRVRQILFDIIGPTVAEGPLLDLYAGSGAMGLEGLSRGATALTAVELARPVRVVLERNLAALEAEAEVLGLAVHLALPRLLREGRAFRWIVADPPYGGRETVWLLGWLGGEGAALLDQPGNLAVETARDEQMPDESGRLRRYRVREVGGTALHFYAIRQEDERR